MPMKHNVLLLIALAAVTTLSAQRITDRIDFSTAPRMATDSEVSAMNTKQIDATTSLRGGGATVVFYEDFSNGLDGNNGIGAMSADDTGGGLIWQFVDPAGDGYYADGSASGVQPPAGEFSGNIGTLSSTSADNGWMVFDCDYYNTPILTGVEDTEGTLELPTLDLTTLNSVVLEYEQYFRYCCYNMTPLYVEVSNDGGGTWVSFEAHGDFIPSANSASANAMTTTLDISCVAAGESAVQIRFAYRQNPLVGNAYSHYYWGIDDVTIYENSTANALDLVQITNGDVWNLFEYRNTPMDQAYAAADGGLLVGVLYRNSGFMDQTGVTLTVDVLDDASNVLSTTVSDGFTAPSFANNDNCPANPQDTMYISTDWEPVDIGEYSIRVTIMSDSISDAAPMEKGIAYTDCHYSHEDPTDLNMEITPRFNDENQEYEPTGYGSRYHFNYEGTTVYGLGVAFGPSNETGVDFEIRWITEDPELSITDAPFEFAEFTSDADWNSTAASPVFYPLAFEDPYEVDGASLTTPTFYSAAIITEFESEVQLTVLGNSNSDTDNSTIIYSQAGSGEFVWFTGQSETPAVRLITCPVVSVDVMAAFNGLYLEGNYPNPTSGITQFVFESQYAGNFSIELHDLQGRLVDVIDLGARPAGEHRVRYNAAQLSSGMYTFTLAADHVRVTKKMRVEH